MSDVSSIKKNIFPGAHDAIWGAFPWHDGAASPRSSQALAVSVFGTLAIHPARQALIDATLNSVFGWDSAGEDPWRVDLERTLGHSLLGERRPTQVDVLLHNQTSVVMLECKFTEAGGSPCSQPNHRPSGAHQGLRQCDGNYHEQTNPVNGKTARCALSAKGIRYWEHIPTYFDLNADHDYGPCPFAGPAYQYMRNLLAAGEWARRRKKERAAFGLVYVAGEGFPVSAEVADPGSEWNQFIARLRPDSAVAAKAISYQALLQTWRQCLPEDDVLADLGSWVDGKINSHFRGGSRGMLEGS
jgi:hypothetical protein